MYEHTVGYGDGKSTPPDIKQPPQETEGERERKKALHKLFDCFGTLFKADMGGTYARPGEKGFSGDAASIFVLTSLANEKGEETPELVKVGWGEFSKKTFEEDKYPAFKNFPHDIYCVSQSDSYFAEGRLAEEIKQDPKKYLKERSIFVANSGQVQLSERQGKKNNLEREIKPVPYEEMLRTARNEIIKLKTKGREFADFLKELPDDPKELGKFMTRLDHEVDWKSETELAQADDETRAEQKRKELMSILWGMGVNTNGIAVGHKEAMESVLALKQQFDFENNQFK